MCREFPSTETLYKLPAIPELCDGHAAFLFVAQCFSEFRDEVFSVSGAVVAALFLVDNAPANEPVRLHHDRVDGSMALCFSLNENGLDIAYAI